MRLPTQKSVLHRDLVYQIGSQFDPDNRSQIQRLRSEKSKPVCTKFIAKLVRSAEFDHPEGLAWDRRFWLQAGRGSNAKSIHSVSLVTAVTAVENI